MANVSLCNRCQAPAQERFITFSHLHKSEWLCDECEKAVREALEETFDSETISAAELLATADCDCCGAPDAPIVNIELADDVGVVEDAFGGPYALCNGGCLGAMADRLSSAADEFIQKEAKKHGIAQGDEIDIEDTEEPALEDVGLKEVDEADEFIAQATAPRL